MIAATRSVLAAGFIVVVASSGLLAQGAGTQGTGGTQGRGQTPGPLVDPSQGAPTGRGGRFGGPARDAQPAPQGTASISGRAIAADTGNPLRRAQVRLTAPEIRVNRATTTGNDGRYEFDDLPAGRYRLQIGKAGYVTLEYGQAHPFEAGKPLDLADGQALDRIDFNMPRGSVIAGRLADEFGDPIADATVQAMRYQYVNGQRQLVAAGRPATSDDMGQYRIYGLMPGDYFVRAAVRQNPLMTADADDPSGYPSTYYPGTTDIGQAQAVTVALGQELTSVFFALAQARLARVSGNVLDSQGRPLAGAIVVARPAALGGMGAAFNLGGTNQVRADGGFTLTGIAPGEYVLDVQQRPRDIQNLGLAHLEFASVPLSVSGADIAGLTIMTTPGVSVSGKVMLQGQNASGTSLRGMQIGAMSPSGPQPGIGGMGIAGRALGGGRVNDDGTFELHGLAGPQLIRVGNIPAGWAVKSISLEGQDVTDAPFDFKSGRDLTGLVVTLTDRLTDVSGTVHDGLGRVIRDYVLVIFPDDAKLWGGQSRYVRTARPNQDGVFALKGLPPARYLAAALESLENGMQNDPAVLESLRQRAKSFTLADGQALSLNLNMSDRQ